MRRTYGRERFLDRVALIREHVPDCALTTDIIVGFPGETEADFAETLEVVEEVGFDGAFTFIYSPRRDTEAAEFVDEFIAARGRRSSAWSASSRSSSGAPASARSASSAGRSRCSSRAPRATTRRACAAARRHNKVVNFDGLASAGEIVPVEIAGRRARRSPAANHWSPARPERTPVSHEETGVGSIGRVRVACAGGGSWGWRQTWPLSRVDRAATGVPARGHRLRARDRFLRRLDPAGLRLQGRLPDGSRRRARPAARRARPHGPEVRRVATFYVSGGASKGIYVYDARTGADVRAYAIPDAGFVNDVAITREAAYFTDSQVQRLYNVRSAVTARRASSRSALTGALVHRRVHRQRIAAPMARGCLSSRRTLAAVHRRCAHGRTREVTLDQPVTMGDGLLLEGEALGRAQPRQPARGAELDREPSTGGPSRRLTDPRFDVPTTIASFGGALYAVNARFDRRTSLTSDVARVAGRAASTTATRPARRQARRPTAADVVRRVRLKCGIDVLAGTQALAEYPSAVCRPDVQSVRAAMRTYVRALGNHRSIEHGRRGRASRAGRDGVVRRFDAPEALDMRFYEVRAKSALNRVPARSQMPFAWTVNPYRGCTHACAYCAGGGHADPAGRRPDAAARRPARGRPDLSAPSARASTAATPRRRCSPTGPRSSRPTA